MTILHWKWNMPIDTISIPHKDATQVAMSWRVEVRDMVDPSVLGLWRPDECRTRCFNKVLLSLQWRYKQRGGVSNHQHLDCLLKRLFRRRSKKTLKLRVTGLCEGTSPLTGEFPAQRASNAENVSIWWRHHVWFCVCCGCTVKFCQLLHIGLRMAMF